MTLGGLAALAPLLKASDSETVAAAVAALRNLSIRKGNEVDVVRGQRMHYNVFMFCSLL